MNLSKNVVKHLHVVTLRTDVCFFIVKIVFCYKTQVRVSWVMQFPFSPCDLRTLIAVSTALIFDNFLRLWLNCATYRLRFSSNLLIRVWPLSVSYNDTSWIQKNQPDKSHRLKSAWNSLNNAVALSVGKAMNVSQYMSCIMCVRCIGGQI